MNKPKTQPEPWPPAPLFGNGDEAKWQALRDVAEDMTLLQLDPTLKQRHPNPVGALDATLVWASGFLSGRGYTKEAADLLLNGWPAHTKQKSPCITGRRRFIGGNNYDVLPNVCMSEGADG